MYQIIALLKLKSKRRFTCEPCVMSQVDKNRHRDWIKAASESITGQSARLLDLGSQITLPVLDVFRPESITEFLASPPTNLTADQSPEALADTHGRDASTTPPHAADTAAPTTAAATAATTTAAPTNAAATLSHDVTPTTTCTGDPTDVITLNTTANIPSETATVSSDRNENVVSNPHELTSRNHQASSERDRDVCPDHIYRICRKRNRTCELRHPRLCPAFLRDGHGPRGCPERNEECGLRHPHICQQAWDDRVCTTVNCPLRHTSTTTRTTQPPAQRQRDGQPDQRSDQRQHDQLPNQRQRSGQPVQRQHDWRPDQQQGNGVGQDSRNPSPRC